MSKLLPWLRVRITPFMKIETLEKEDIPDEPGVYIMISDQTEYTYPWSTDHGKSQVYYIGQSKSLRERLMLHKKYCREAKSKPVNEYYWPRYEYAAYHGCNISWVISQNPKPTEKRFLVAFANYYGAKPVANGQSAWEFEERNL